MVIVRRHGFSNDQWLMEGLNLLELKYRAPGYFTSDPSNIVRPNACPDRLHLPIDRALAALPRDAFDYVLTRSLLLACSRSGATAVQSSIVCIDEAFDRRPLLQ
jgi:hypothetical protein